MNNIVENIFNKKAFIPFITAGDPSIEITEKLIISMSEAGADLIELGIPFSDPVAEGPVIQEADNRALKAGTTTDKIFDMLIKVRKSCNVPIAFMTYANPIFTYGTERFVKKCKEVNVSAIIVPDIPYEEREELIPFCKEYGVTMISMIAPTSKERIHMIAKEAEGFIYCVSSMGVTGVRESIGDEVVKMINNVKEVKDIPCAVGFGISNPNQVGNILNVADGVIVGSAIVKIIAEQGENCIPYVKEYVKNWCESIHN